MCRLPRASLVPHLLACVNRQGKARQGRVWLAPARRRRSDPLTVCRTVHCIRRQVGSSDYGFLFQALATKGKGRDCDSARGTYRRLFLRDSTVLACESHLWSSAPCRVGYPLMSVYTKKHDLPTYPEPPGNPIYLVRKPLLTVTPTLPRPYLPIASAKRASTETLLTRSGLWGRN